MVVTGAITRFKALAGASIFVNSRHGLNTTPRFDSKDARASTLLSHTHICSTCLSSVRFYADFSRWLNRPEIDSSVSLGGGALTALLGYFGGRPHRSHGGKGFAKAQCDCTFPFGDDP